MDIHVEMHLSYETDVWAYGMVTLENIIRFPVQLRKFKNKDTGEETSFLSYPRRERCGKWENCMGVFLSTQRNVEAFNTQ